MAASISPSVSPSPSPASLLAPEDYDISYFDGRISALRHNAGYGKYARWYRHEGANSTGEWWKDIAASHNLKYNLVGKETLEVGCAKGFLVEDLRELGANAYGLDVSPYAIGEADPAIQPYLYTGDARTALAQFSNKQFDVLFSLRFFECMPETDIPGLVNEMKRISKFQFHVIGENSNPDYYLTYPLEWWLDFAWPKNTVLISHETGREVTK